MTQMSGERACDKVLSRLNSVYVLCKQPSAAARSVPARRGTAAPRCAERGRAPEEVILIDLTLDA